MERKGEGKGKMGRGRGRWEMGRGRVGNGEGGGREETTPSKKLGYGPEHCENGLRSFDDS